MAKKYFMITPLKQNCTFIDHNIIARDGSGRKWSATQTIGSQLGYRNFDNPVKQKEANTGQVFSDPNLSGYFFEDDFDYISEYDYWFDESFGDAEKQSLIEAYEGGSGDGVGAAWLESGDHEWKLDGDEILSFCCSIKIDLIDEDGVVLEENIKPSK